MRKEILIDLTSLDDNFSGIERFAWSISEMAITNKDFDFVLVFKNKIPNDFIFKAHNVRTKIIKGTNKLIFNQIILPMKLYGIKADYYFFPAFPAPFLFFNKQSISAIHDLGCWDCPHTNKWYMKLYFKILYSKAAFNNKRIVTVSDFSKLRIQEILKVNQENIAVIHNGISSNFTEFKKNSEVSKKVCKKYNLPEKYLLCLSTLEPRKNLPLLLKTYEVLINEDKVDYDLVLAGRKGWMIDDIFQNMSEKVIKRIHITGFIEEADLPYIYQCAELFVFPSIYEGFGIPPLESLASHTMVVSSDAASLPEILKESVIYFKSNDSEDLKKKLIFALNLNDSEKENYLNKGKKLVSNYSWNDSAKKLLNFIVKEK